MSQDRFDEWLRGQVSPEVNSDELNAEWSKYELRVDSEGRRRKGALWWFLGGFALLGVSLTFGILFLGQQSEHDDNQPMIEQSSDAPVITQELPFAHRDNDASKGEVRLDRLTDEDAKVEIEEKNMEPQELYDGSNIAATSLVDGVEKESIFLSQFASSGTPISEGEPEDVFSSSPESIYGLSNQPRLLEPVEPIASLKTPLRSRIGIESFSEVDFVSLQSDPTNSHSWLISSQIHAGVARSRYSFEKEYIRGAYDFSSAEAVGIEWMVWKSIGKGWRVGAGLNLAYQHHVLTQRDTVTSAGSKDDQLVGIVQLQDGTSQMQRGVGQGQWVTANLRTLHHEYFSTSIPFGIAYERSLSPGWKWGANIMIHPTYHHHRLGTDMLYSENTSQWQMDDLDRSFSSRYTLGSSASVYCGYEIYPNWVMTWGMGGRTEWIGSKMTDGRNQFLSSLFGQVGLQMHI